MWSNPKTNPFFKQTLTASKVAVCYVCGRKAVYCPKYEGRCYCEDHFMRWFEGKVRSTLRRFNYFGKKENIVVAVSGGKDSLAALTFLKELSKKVPGWKVSALLIDEGIKGYRDVTIKDFLRVVEELNVDYKIVSFKEEFGLTLDEMVRTGEEKKLPYLPCTYCGVMRRYLLNKYAREMGATVLVTAHNLDDVLQTFLLDLLRGDTKKLPRLGPVTGISSHEKFVKRVKLFYEIPEKEVVIYALLKGVYPETYVECPYAPLSVRWHIRKWLNTMEEKYPGIKFSLLKSLLHIIKKVPTEGKIGTCKVCGEPSSKEVCRTCQLLTELRR